MNTINCDICLDLMPLVQDGVASPASRKAVEEHLACCEECRAMFEGIVAVPAGKEKLLGKLSRKLQLGSAMVLMFGILFGLSLPAGNGIFYNSLIMPLIGLVGYYLFRWKAVVLIPVLLYVMHFITNALGLGAEYLTLPSLVMWTGLYCLFAVIGVVIGGLLHFAFRKEN
ncbi:MAG: zf-HC2 domain-containing protein [Oscillospiraceae bacterium]|nr:zf-HC2 domain-containing protein [Oscillospiraceae bacterium]MBR2890163.1 zf-HC2 domain-containing protein [Oscillospiraceae bacterium]